MATFAQYCPCGWSMKSEQPHEHQKRLQTFAEARRAKAPKFRHANPKRRPRHREMADA